MKVILTTGLHRFLLNDGCKYCFSDTIAIGQDEDAFTSITLKPVKQDPIFRKMPKSYEMYYNLVHEPSDMAAGRIGFLIQVKLTKKEFQKYSNALSTNFY
jgi:hypothetical protein